MASEKLDSSKTIEIVKRHKESVEGYVRRHDLDIYQINKLIKAETALRDRNSVLNFLRKEKDKIRRKTARENALKEDFKPNRVTQKGEDVLDNLRNDIIDIRQQMTDINAAPVRNDNRDEEENTSSESSSSAEESQEDVQDRKNSSSLSPGEKSRRKLHEEVENHFDSLPDSESSRMNGIVSSFRNLLSGEEKEEDVASLTSDLQPEDIFDEIERKSDREKAIKAAYTVKRALENSQDVHLGYGRIAEEIEDMDLENSSKTAEFFRFMEDYDHLSTPEVDELDKVLNDCRAVVRSFS